MNEFWTESIPHSRPMLRLNDDSVIELSTPRVVCWSLTIGHSFWPANLSIIIGPKGGFWQNFVRPLEGAHSISCANSCTSTAYELATEVDNLPEVPNRRSELGNSAQSRASGEHRLLCPKLRAHA